MQKFKNPCIKTGEFAKLCNTNKRTLFHYDEIGLFSPAYTDEKGYRYYTESQCDMFFTITCLKELGMPLKNIKQYIDNRNPEDLKLLLQEQQNKVQDELMRLHRIEKVIETKLELVKCGKDISFQDRVSRIFLQDCPEEYLIVSPPLNTSDHQKLFEAICEHIDYCNYHMLNTGHPYGAMLSVDQLRQGHEDTYAHFFTKVASPLEGHPCTVKAAGNYAVIYLKGNYYDASKAYERLFEFFEKNSLTSGEFCYKEAIWDEIAVSSEEDYITKISVKIL